MSQPIDDDIPPDDLDAEIEMGVEEFLGRPVSGKPEERIEALKKRIKYLTEQLDLALLKSQPDGVARLNLEMFEAEKQLEEFKAQYERRN